MGILLGKISVEVPDHRVVQTADGYEVRRYPSQVSAIVRAADLPDTYDGSKERESKFTTDAFRLLGRYIGAFGSAHNLGVNSVAVDTVAVTTSTECAPESISMTAPVVVTPFRPADASATSDAPVSSQSMRFLLPADKYKCVDDAPVPSNEAIKLEVVEGGRCEAVRSFSGNFDMGSARSEADMLLKDLDRDAVAVVGHWDVQGYNPPFTLPWLKRNEIHVPVDPAAYAGIEGDAPPAGQ